MTTQHTQPTCAGYFHHAGSVEVEEARLPTWWPRRTDQEDERLELWEAFQTRYAELSAQVREWRRQAKEQGEAQSFQGQKLTPADRAVYNVLLFGFLNRQDGRCDPSQGAIAEKTGLHRATVARALRRLLMMGFLNWERRKTLMRRGAVWWVGQASNLYRFIRSTMSQKATGTPIHILTLSGGRLTTIDAWTERLQFRLRHARSEEERKREMIARCNQYWQDDLI